MRSLRVLGLWALVFGVLCSYAQNSTPSDSDTLPTFRSRSELVFVPVVVTRHGDHVPGLKKDAFRVEQDGKPQEISVFEEVTEATPPSDSPPQMAPDVITNYTVADRQPRRLLIVILDMVNTPHRNQARAKAALIKFLATSVPRDEPVSLLAFSSTGLKQLHSFTTDTSVLIDGLQKIKSKLGTEDIVSADASQELGQLSETLTSNSDIRSLAAWMQSSAAMEYSFGRKNAIQSTLSAMQQVAGAFAGIPGRKALLWATDGFPAMLADPHSITGMSAEMFDEYQSAWKMMNAANIAIYPIGLEGLVAGQFDASRKEPAFNPMRRGAIPPVPKFDDRQQRHDTMRTFAENTGGRAYLNNNDILHGFKEAARDSHAYYMLAYYLRSDSKPGWHKLKVHVDSSHSDIRARDGFFVGSPTQDTRQQKNEFLTALASPVDYTGIHFGLKFDPLPPPTSSMTRESKRTVPFRIMIPPSSLNFSGPDDTLSIEFAAMALRKNGDPAGDTVGKLNSALKPEAVQKLMKTGLILKAAVDLPPGQYELRVGIRDSRAGIIGTLRSPLKVD